MDKSTKEKILDAALKNFAENGYKGTNLRDLAAETGLSKSALYKHYAGKEDIWNALIDEMEAYYNARFGSSENLPPIPESTQELKVLTMRMLDFTVHDKKIIMTRKILLTEQFRDERVCMLVTKHFYSELESMFTKIFAGMMENGSLKKGDPAILAFAYTAPISTLVQLCDREPEKCGEAMQKAEAFSKYFTEAYGRKETENLL